MPGYTLELFYRDGRPDGLVTAEIFGWTGHLLKLPRTRLQEVKDLPVALFTGVYLLLGEEAGRTTAYVGEADQLWWRIRDHDLSKDWWTHAVWITSSANKLNKAHVRYLEARLCEEAARIGQVDLRNGTKPNRPSLSEPETANMEAFLAQVLMALPALRVDVFIENARPTPVSSKEGVGVPGVAENVLPRFKLDSPKRGVTAFAYMQQGEFIVEKGSTAKPAETNQSGYAALHQSLTRAGVLAEEGGIGRFTKNYAFASPSAAAAIVMGRSANGTTEWRTVDTGKTYKEWEAAQIGATA